MEDYDMDDVSSPATNAQQPIWVPPPGLPDTLNRDGEALLIVKTFEDQSTADELQEFVNRWPPSRTPSLYCAWIAVDRGGHRRHTPDLSGLATSFQALISSENVTVPEIDRIALAHGVLSGKWLIYTSTRYIDRLWEKVVQMLCLELRKGSAKVSPKKDEDSHVICVYVDNYSDVDEVNAMRAALRTIGVAWKIGFKPDVYTHLQIYSNNQWKIRPSRYFI